MRRSIVTQRRALIAVVAVLLVSSFLQTRLATAIADPARDVVNLIASPFTHPLHALSSWVRGPAELDDVVDDRRELAERNRELLQYSRQLEDQLRRARQQIAELTGLRHDPSLALGGVRLQPAGVTSSRGGANPTLVINRGSRHGVGEGMVVVAGANLVGRVVDTAPTGATVSLISRPGTLLDVRIAPPTAGPAPRQTIVQAQPAPDGDQFWAEASHDDPIEVGDLAHLRLADNVLETGARWPDDSAGLIVGQVVEITNDPADPTLRRRIVIQPRRSLQYLTRVVVLTPATQ